MRITLSKDLIREFPRLQVAIFHIQNLDNSVNSDPSFQYLCKVMDQLRLDYKIDDLKQIENISNWREAFKTAGIDPKEFSPSHDSLAKRVLDRKDLPNINPIVNIINALQLEVFLPIGAHDLDKAEGNITIGGNTKSLKFNERGSDVLTEVPDDEFVYADDKSVLTRRWCWRMGQKTVVDQDSKSIALFVDLLATSQAELNELALRVNTLVKEFLPKAKVSFGAINGSENICELDSLKEVKEKNKLKFKSFPISRDEEIISKILTKGVEEILPSQDSLEDLLLSGRRLKVYYGIDPTADTLHIGHTVHLRRLEFFRQLGHEAILLIGNFTAQIGDPTDKSAARQKLTTEQVEENLKLYVEQAKAILDVDNSDNPVRIVFNKDWLGQMDFAAILELASEFSVQQMLKRSMFAQRLEEDKPIYIHEFMYPLMQGWDSVNLECDVEIGGNDQLFNMLAGRTLVANHLNKEKFVIAGKLLTTADGKKMGKSEGNAVSLKDSARDVYGKIMAMNDEQIVPAFELLTDADMAEVNKYEHMLSEGVINPIEIKKHLAFKITTELKGEEEAKDAQEYFQKVFQEGSSDVQLPVVEVKANPINILELLVQVEFAKSKSDARRLVEQGAVKIGEEKLNDWKAEIKLEDSSVLSAGRKIVKIKVD